MGKRVADQLLFSGEAKKILRQYKESNNLKKGILRAKLADYNDGEVPGTHAIARAIERMGADEEDEKLRFLWVRAEDFIMEV